MISRHRLLWLVILLCGMSWLITACVRPTPDESAGLSPTAVAEPDLSDPNVGGGVMGDNTPTSLPPAYPAATESVVTAAPPTSAPQEATAVAPEATMAPAEATVAPTEAAPTAAATVPAPTAAPATSGETAVTAGEQSHVVQPGENLFRIGLQYGVSWVTLAQYNGLSNPNDIRAGQTIKIPPTGTVPPTATPVPPGNITFYTVQPGDNLFRIGQKFGVSWVQIAEANGLVNPNQIVVGQTLKIPVSAPGPTPEFTHVVKQGETIFRIAVQYGVSWISIAEANDIQSPYVIYAGQTLIIPGS